MIDLRKCPCENCIVIPICTSHIRDGKIRKLLDKCYLFEEYYWSKISNDYFRYEEEMSRIFRLEY